MANLKNDIFVRDQLIQSFDSAAETYEENAVLQAHTADDLIEKLKIMKVRPKSIMDLGSGTGGVASRISPMFPNANMVLVDISLGMLGTSRHRTLSNRKKRANYICANAEQMPFASNSFDLVVSNLMLQWGENYPKIFAGVNAILKPGGLFVFSTLGPSTLMELRDAWSEVDEYKHVNEFVDMHILGDALISSGLTEPVMESDSIIMNFPSASKVMSHLKKIGAHNVNTGRRKTLTGKGRLREVTKRYELLWTRDGLPCSYEVIYGHAWKPAEAKKGPSPKEQIFLLARLKDSLARIANK
jgi:malonyl-CoA O-methyltransferase